MALCIIGRWSFPFIDGDELVHRSADSIPVAQPRARFNGLPSVPSRPIYVGESQRCGQRHFGTSQAPLEMVNFGQKVHLINLNALMPLRKALMHIHGAFFVVTVPQ
jgi:hypothetical protein